MTFRAKPVVKRSSKNSWESRDRRNTLLNIGFVVVIVGAVLLLLDRRRRVVLQRQPGRGRQRRRRVDLQGRAGATASLIEDWRLDEAERRVRTQVVAGRLTQAQADVQEQIIDQQQAAARAPSRWSASSTTGCRPTLAEQEGITVTDADVDAQLVKEATTPEERHVWLIEVEPTVDDGEVEPIAPAIAEAKAKAEAALRDLRARQELGRGRQDRLDRHVDRAAGRRPGLAQRRRQPGRRGLPDRRLRGGRRHARPRSSRARTASSASAG